MFDVSDRQALQRDHPGHTLAALAVQTAAIWGFALLVPGTGVRPAAWAVLHGLGAAWIVASRRVPWLRLSVGQALGLAGAALWLAALFFGADGALTALGNSVKPRQALPDGLGGLALWFCLVPGVAGVGLALAVQGVLRERSR